ncbi:MAG: hypothetical protein ACLFUS_09325, partial [Candidatus Sumerlaeia bacterium]
ITHEVTFTILSGLRERFITACGGLAKGSTVSAPQFHYVQDNSLAIIGRALGPEDEKAFALLRKPSDSLLQINTAPIYVVHPISAEF